MSEVSPRQPGTMETRTAGGRAERLSDRDDRDRLQARRNARQAWRRGDGVLRRSNSPGGSRAVSLMGFQRQERMAGCNNAGWVAMALLRDRDRHRDRLGHGRRHRLASTQRHTVLGNEVKTWQPGWPVEPRQAGPATERTMTTWPTSRSANPSTRSSSGDRRPVNLRAAAAHRERTHRRARCTWR